MVGSGSTAMFRMPGISAERFLPSTRYVIGTFFTPRFFEIIGAKGAIVPGLPLIWPPEGRTGSHRRLQNASGNRPNGSMRGVSQRRVAPVLGSFLLQHSVRQLHPLLVEQNARYALETAARGYVLQTG